MGQRLVVTVNDNGKDICKMYFHWSAYSMSALYVTRDILDAILSDDDIMDLRLRLIRFCEAYGGGIKNGKDSDEWKYIQNTYPNEIFKEEGISRNCGLIAISEDGMNDLQDWSEGDIIINIDTHRVINLVNWFYDSVYGYNNNRKEWDSDWIDVCLEDIPELECNLCDFNYEDIDYLIEALDNAPDFVVRYGNEIYELIA